MTLLLRVESHGAYWPDKRGVDIQLVPGTKDSAPTCS